MFPFLVPDNYVHRLVQNKGDGKLVEVLGQSGLVGALVLGYPESSVASRCQVNNRTPLTHFHEA